MPRRLVEEKWNSITHAVMLGFLLSTIFSNSVSIVVYSVGMSVAMVFSVLYHAIEGIERKKQYRKLDMMSIHVAISASGVSYILSYGDPLLVVPVVLVGLLGIMYVHVCYGRSSFEKGVAISFVLFGIATACFTVGGLFLTGNLLNLLSFVVGVLLYLTGLVFYVKDIREWYHTVWHLFVMAGIVVHYCGLE
tara:strand:- start:5788 stop:6363 length:576 start_codon:yes stop_codon:yes gene_type:complete